MTSALATIAGRAFLTSVSRTRTRGPRIGRCLGPEKLGRIETFKVPDTLEVVPPPPIRPIEDSAALKPPISGYLDDELTFTEPVMPRLIACKDD
jgi:hypothetical protein